MLESRSDHMLTQAILPVAGYGTRFLPWTKVVPKELLPIGSKPIIAHLVDECLSVGIKDICFVISRGKEKIPEFFQTDEALEKVLADRGKSHLLHELTKYHEVRFTTVYQEEMRGDGHAILQARDWVSSPAVAVLFGDDLIVHEKTGLQQLESAWSQLLSPEKSAMLCLQDVEREDVHRYGIVDIEPTTHKSRLRKITGLIEKPSPEDAPSTLGIVGKYIVPRATIDQLAEVESGHKDQEIRLIDALKVSLQTSEVYGYELEGKRYDTGNPAGYREAVMELG